ncbi:unnamed protein product [Cuscuta europaea]|uniref:RING-type domain-containing protein n=2 Tax=Cuscuta europaea TaxID=41803 RepID=A0A9P1EC32_CUSEU|nr:unnamed protein product [Cuscuta europaea]
MRCNACWRELEGQAISTTCGHIFCTEDADKILSTDAACPICSQVLSKSLMKPVDINPSEDWINMAIVGVAPQMLMESAYRSVAFYIGQKELEMDFKMNKIVTQCRQKCEVMEQQFSEKLEQMQMAYQKMSKRCQMMEQEVENLSRDKKELQEKFAEKSRQRRKLEEMYDELSSKYGSVKRTAIRPAPKCYSRTNPNNLFSNPANMTHYRDPIRKEWSVSTPDTPGPREGIWPPPARQHASDSGPYEISSDSTAKQPGISMDARNTTGARPVFGPRTVGSNPSMIIRNLIISPIKRPNIGLRQLQLFS